MGRFCTKCGSPKDEQGRCPKCDAPAPAVQQEVLSNNGAAAPAPAPKRNMPKLNIKLVSIVAAALVVCIVCGILLLNNCSGGGGSAQSYANECVLKIGGVDTYVGGLISPLDDIEYGKVVEVDKENLENARGISSYRCASDGETVYGLMGDHVEELYKITYSSGKYKKEVWVTNEKLQTVDMGQEFGGKKNCRFFYNPVCCNDDVYFLNMPGVDSINKYFNVAYKIGKISKSGGDIEYIEGVRAEAFTIADGWIYYFDNGIKDNTSYIEYDDSRAGIYRMKTDGSDKEPLVTGLKPRLNHDTYGYAATSLRVDGGYLYYIDYTEDGLGRLCRVNTGGGQPEYITKYGIRDYTFDSDGNVYYMTNKLEDGFDGAFSDRFWSLFKVSKNGGDDVELEESLGSMSYNDLAYNDGYLYFCDYGKFCAAPVNKGEEPTQKSGRRYDIRNREFATLYAYTEIEETIADDGFPERKEYGSYYKWVKE